MRKKPNVKDILVRVQGDCSETCGAMTIKEALRRLRECVPKAKVILDNPEYMNGWNNCRQAMLKEFGGER